MFLPLQVHQWQLQTACDILGVGFNLAASEPSAGIHLAALRLDVSSFTGPAPSLRLTLLDAHGGASAIFDTLARGFRRGQFSDVLFWVPASLVGAESVLLTNHFSYQGKDKMGAAVSNFLNLRPVAQSTLRACLDEGRRLLGAAETAASTPPPSPSFPDSPPPCGVGIATVYVAESLQSFAFELQLPAEAAAAVRDKSARLVCAPIIGRPSALRIAAMPGAGEPSSKAVSAAPPKAALAWLDLIASLPLSADSARVLFSRSRGSITVKVAKADTPWMILGVPMIDVRQPLALPRWADGPFESSDAALFTAAGERSGIFSPLCMRRMALSTRPSHALMITSLFVCCQLLPCPFFYQRGR